LRAFTVADFADGRNPLEDLHDPSGFLATHGPAGVALLRSNPWAQETDLALAIVVDDRQVVGRLGFYAGPGPVWAPNQRVIWLSGFFLDSAYRNTGAGGMLLLRALASRRDILAAGSPNKNLETIYDKTGFVRLGPLQRWVHFYNAGVIAAKFVGMRWLRTTANVTGWPLLKTYHLCRRPLPTVDGVEFQRVSQLPTELEEPVGRGSPEEAFQCRAKVWNWVLPHKPTETMPFAILRHGRPYGYCILRHYDSPGGGPHGLPPMHIGELQDFQVPDDEAAAEVLRFARAQFAQVGCDVFELQCRHPPMETFCGQAGMIRLGGNRIFYRPRNKKDFEASRQWRFTAAVADMTLA
jgi:GNAT superfamily N-acetyltransferase